MLSASIFKQTELLSLLRCSHICPKLVVEHLLNMTKAVSEFFVHKFHFTVSNFLPHRDTHQIVSFAPPTLFICGYL